MDGSPDRSSSPRAPPRLRRAGVPSRVGVLAAGLLMTGAAHADAFRCGTRLVVEGGRFTGEVVSPLAFGHGKVTLAEAWAREHGVDLAQSVFYSDSISDLPMLERVGRARVINPDPRLRWTARRRRWPIEHW